MSAPTIVIRIRVGGELRVETFADTERKEQQLQPLLTQIEPALTFLRLLTAESPSENRKAA